MPSPIARHPKGDKISRVMAAAGMIQTGRLFVPERAHWVADYTGELLGFPGAAHDDQVDATSQLLLWVQEKDLWRTPANAGPELIAEGDGADPFAPGYGIAWPGQSEQDPWGAY